MSKQFDYLIVFGEGPVKPILLPHELSPSQKDYWYTYKQDPISTVEPDFWCMQERRHVRELEKVVFDETLSDSEKKRIREVVRQRWQRDGNYSLKQWGTQNALAAGQALYKGKAKRVILTGGKTVPSWAKDVLPKERLETWPSEAELMKSVIVSSYGALYLKKYGKPIDEVLTIEDASTNTLENFAFTINNQPDLLNNTKRIGILTANHHLKRVTHLAKIFSIPVNEDGQQSAQEILAELEEEERAAINKTFAEPSSEYIRSLTSKEDRWLAGLTTPEYITYWLGYIGLVKNTLVIQNAISRLKSQPWRDVACVAFKKLDLNFEDYEEEDIVTLAKDDPEKYQRLIKGLRKMKDPTYRILPPLLKQHTHT